MNRISSIFRAGGRLAARVAVAVACGCGGPASPIAEPIAATPALDAGTAATADPGDEREPAAEAGASTAEPLAAGEQLTAVSADMQDISGRPLLAVSPSSSPGCDPPTAPPSFGRCSPVAPRVVRASGNGDPVLGADGDSCTVWSSGGFAPAAFDLDFGRTAIVHGVVLVPEMTPEEGETVNVVEASDDGERYAPVLLFRRVMQTKRPVAVLFTETVSARFLRVRTVQTESWVAWREVVPFACEGGAVVPAGLSEPPEEPPRSGPVTTFHKGRGRCKRQEDCWPDDCCAPGTCVAKKLVRKCKTHSCPDMLGPMTAAGAWCACHEGRCGAMYPGPPP